MGVTMKVKTESPERNKIRLINTAARRANRKGHKWSKVKVFNVSQFNRRTQ